MHHQVEDTKTVRVVKSALMRSHRRRRRRELVSTAQRVKLNTKDEERNRNKARQTRQPTKWRSMTFISFTIFCYLRLWLIALQLWFVSIVCAAPYMRARQSTHGRCGASRAPHRSAGALVEQNGKLQQEVNEVRHILYLLPIFIRTIIFGRHAVDRRKRCNEHRTRLRFLWNV